jgi:hypothetical protein
MEPTEYGMAEVADPKFQKFLCAQRQKKMEPEAKWVMVALLMCSQRGKDGKPVYPEHTDSELCDFVNSNVGMLKTVVSNAETWGWKIQK